MTSRTAPPDPFDVVAAALRCPKEALSGRSAMYRDHGWDSLGHVSVISNIEDVLQVTIDDDEAWKLTTMKAISEFFNLHSGMDGE